MSHHAFHFFARIFGHHGRRAGLVLIALSLFAATADACCQQQAAAVTTVRAAAATCACAAPAVRMITMPITYYLQTYYVQPQVAYVQPQVAYVQQPQSVVVQPRLVPAETPLPAPPPLPPERSVATATATETTTTTVTTREVPMTTAVMQSDAVGVDQVGVMGVTGVARKLTLRERFAQFRASRDTVVVEQQAVVSVQAVQARPKRCRLF
jgi:hypothetical protein